MKLVLFDFDSTLTAIDTTLPYGVFFSQHGDIRFHPCLLALALELARARILSNTALKRRFARLVLRGQSAERIAELALAFCRSCLVEIVDEKMLGILRTHVQAGDEVYLLSANLDCLLEPLVEQWKLAGVMATKPVLCAGTFTGEIAGLACHGREKLRRAVERFGAEAVAKATAYGNKNDRTLLEAVRTGYLVSRSRPAFPFGRLREQYRILSEKPSRRDLVRGSVIELYPGSRATDAPDAA